MSNETPIISPPNHVLDLLEGLASNVDRLRKTVLRHGQAQELFQQRIDEKVERMTAAAGAEEMVHAPRLDQAQLRALLAFDKAVLAMHRSAAAVEASGTSEASEASEASHGDDPPASIREGLDLLHIRVRNLQHSFGLEPIAALGHPFDDRLHQVVSTCRHLHIADGQIVEETLPGYRLDGEVLRPALVIVNQHQRQTYPASNEEP